MMMDNSQGYATWYDDGKRFSRVGINGGMSQGVTSRVTQGVTSRVTQGVTDRVTQGVTDRVTQGVTDDMMPPSLQNISTNTFESDSYEVIGILSKTDEETTLVTENVTLKKETKQNKEENPPAPPKEEKKQNKEKTKNTHKRGRAREKKQGMRGETAVKYSNCNPTIPSICNVKKYGYYLFSRIKNPHTQGIGITYPDECKVWLAPNIGGASTMKAKNVFFALHCLRLSLYLYPSKRRVVYHEKEIYNHMHAGIDDSSTTYEPDNQQRLCSR